MPTLWIPKDEYKTLITDARLTQIIGNDETLIEEAESYAKAVVKDSLFSRYDIDAVYNANANDYPVVKRWIMYIVLYQLWQRVPDKQIPDRVLKNYEDTQDRLTEIEDGKASFFLPQLQTTDTPSTKVTKFRWGSNIKRSH
jgi:hypothetical protein